MFNLPEIALLDVIVEHALSITMLSVALFVFSVACVLVFLTRIPPTYFQDSHRRDFMRHYPISVRWAGKIVKNLLGVALVLCGLVMAIPGVPGQGILTIVVGLALLDLPGKQRYERKLLSRSTVATAINRIRRKFSKRPLVLD